MEESKWKEMIESRNLDPETVFFASFMAGLNEFGILNQMVMKVAGKTSGGYMAKCFKACYSEETGKTLSELVSFLNDKLNISGKDFAASETDGKLTVKIRTDKCRYCPKGVGGAELEGTICPFPGIIESFVNEISQNKIKASPVNGKLLNKEEGFCVITFEKEK
jgi:predicted hydrocarbon binding protein